MIPFLRPLISAAAILLSAAALSQEESKTPQAGFVQIVNLVSLETPTYVTVAGLPVSGGDPVPSGESSGVVALVPNEYTFTVSNESAKPSSKGGAITVEDGSSVVIVLFDEEREFRDGSRETKLRFTKLKGLAKRPKAQVSLLMLSSRASAPLSVNGETTIVASQIAFPLKVQLEDEIEIKFNNKEIGTIEVEEPIHYIVFLYDDPDSGGLKLSVVMEERLEYQAPMKENSENGSPEE